MQILRPVVGAAVLLPLLTFACQAQTSPSTADEGKPAAPKAEEPPRAATDKPTTRSKTDNASAGPHIVARSVRPPDRAASDTSQYGLTRRDFGAVVNALPNATLAVPIREIAREARRGDQAADVKLVGTVTEFARLHQLPIARGRFLVELDVKQLRNVAVIGADVAHRLFFEVDPIGESIQVGDQTFLVIGTAPARRRRAGAAEDTGLHVFIPLSTMRARLGDRNVVRQSGSFRLDHFELTRIEILLESVAEVETSAKVVENVLDALHEDNSYTVTTLFDELAGQDQ